VTVVALVVVLVICANVCCAHNIDSNKTTSVLRPTMAAKATVLGSANTSA
jgi:hypothetical protein